MKLTISIFILFFSSVLYACDCSERQFAEKYSASKFVAEVTVIKTYTNKDDEGFYKADIRLNKLYKGDKTVKSISIYGNNGGQVSSSCDIAIPTGSKLLIYTNYNGNGIYGIGMCSGFLNMYNLSQKGGRELKMLKSLDSKKSHFSTSSKFHFDSEFYAKLQELKGLNIEKTYGLYQIEFNPDMSIKYLSAISGFNHPVDQTIMEMICSTQWKPNMENTDSKKEMILALYYYASQNEYQSFISIYNL